MYNTKRLEDIILVMEDCLGKLDNFNKAYKEVNNVYTKLFMEEGFRGYLKSFQEQLIKYLAHTSKGLYNRRDKLKYKDIINLHKSANRLENVSIDFLLELRDGRNYFAHGYEEPDFQSLYEFFIRYRNEFDNVIKCINNTIREENDKNNTVVNDKKSELDLYNLIEIARNLLDVLDDEVIAKKTGLDIDLIKQLRLK